MTVSVPVDFCPHRDDAPCSVCVDLVAVRSERDRLAGRVSALEDALCRLQDDFRRQGRFPLSD